MKKQKFGDYYVGLDLGTNSVGWAATDKKYKILRFNHKSMWGIRLFSEAKTAQDRRTFRVARRRLQRQNDRITFLNQAFQKQLNAIDSNFLTNLSNSRLYQEDKVGTENIHTLFNDNKYTDKEFYQEFPTIYHLRYAMMHREKKQDLRFIYLALHEMMKHRGHFLYKGKFSTSSSFQNIIEELNENFKLCFDIIQFIERDNYAIFQQTIKNRGLDNNSRKKELYSMLVPNEEKQSFGERVIDLLVSGKIKAKRLFDVFEDDDKFEINLSSEDFEIDINEEPRFTDVQKALLFSIKKLFDWALLSNIMQGKAEISSAMIQSYETHKVQLALLKKVFKEDVFLKDKYAEFFHSGETGYGAYIGNEPPKKGTKNTSRANFYDALKSYFNSKKTQKTEEMEQILELINKDAFLIKPKSNKNGVIPHQLHEFEFRKILEKAEQWYPFLKEKDESGLTLSERLIAIFNFKIPYYIGPLNDSHPVEEGGHAWVVRKEVGNVYPWNVEEKIDIEQTATKFIRNMTAKCTYLPSEDVLPKNSLHYQVFEVLNEINNVRLDGRELPIHIKKELIEDLYKQQSGNVTKKKIERWLYDHNYLNGVSTTVITGVDTILHTRLTSYHFFREILGDHFPETKILEDIIFWLTCFPDEPVMIASKINATYPGVFNNKEIERMAAKHMVGWGRFSETFLTGLQSESLHDSNGKGLTILEALFKTNLNLMELLSSAGGFSHVIEKFNEKNFELAKKMDSSALKDLPVSPAAKRPIWQTLRILEELSSITGHHPSKIFVEMAREKQQNAKRTESRKSQLEKLYKNLKEYQSFITDNDLSHLNKIIDSKEEREFRRKKLYLYLLQMGKSMYTQKSISLSDLFDNNKYDIDHIYPQSLTGEGDFNNLVLVEKELNAEKSNKILSPEIQKKMMPFWKYLKSKHFISEEKFKRLCRTTPLSIDEKMKFISRQLVETRQSTKALTQLLKKYYPESRIVYVKAGHVSQFRHQQKNLNKEGNLRNPNYRHYIKVRMINDFHHAKDAYLNIVVGNVYFTKFTNNPLNFIRKLESMTPMERKKNPSEGTYNLMCMFDYDVIRGKDVAWIAGSEGSIQMVDSMMAKNDILSTRLPLNGKGALFNLQPVPKGKDLVNLKKGLPSEKYGGYNSSATGYFFIVRGKKKGKEVLSMEQIPLILANQIDNTNKLRTYCAEVFQIEDPKILLDHIHPIDELVVYNGIRARLKGRSKNYILLKMDQQPLFTENEIEIWKKLEKAMRTLQQAKVSGNSKTIEEKEEPLQDISDEELKVLYGCLQKKVTLSIYRDKLRNENEVIQSGMESFSTLSKEDKIYTLLEVLSLFTTKKVSNGQWCDLSKIGGKRFAGAFQFNKNLLSAKSLAVIFQSVTGLFEKRCQVN